LSFKNFAPWLLVIFLFGAFLQQTWLVTFSVALAVVFLLAQVWKEHALKGVTYTRRWHYRRGFPGAFSFFITCQSVIGTILLTIFGLFLSVFR